MSWPVDPPPDDDDTVVVGRMANIIIPFMMLDTGRLCRIHMIMPEADARAIVNMHPDQARAMGEFFVVIRDSLAMFIDQEG